MSFLCVDMFFRLWSFPFPDTRLQLTVGHDMFQAFIVSIIPLCTVLRMFFPP